MLTWELNGQTEEEKEIIAFNNSFDAYNKKVMYGIDIISVLNKAIDNNRTYGIEFYNNPKEKTMLDHYVNIIFTYNENIIEGTGKDNIVTFSLKDNYTGNPNIIKTKFIDPVINGDSNMYGFKTAAFKCTKVTYNDNNVKDERVMGRIIEMRFEQINR